MNGNPLPLRHLRADSPRHQDCARSNHESASLDRGSGRPADGAIGSGPVKPRQCQVIVPSDTLQPLSALPTSLTTRSARGRCSPKSARSSHPRCVNCHPRTERPLQGEDGALHQPLVVRGAGGMGAAGMVLTCHNADNFRHVPGHPAHLAPGGDGLGRQSLTATVSRLKTGSATAGRPWRNSVRT